MSKGSISIHTECGTHRLLINSFIQEDELDLWIPEEVFIEKPDTVFPLAYVLQTPSQSFPLDWTSVLNLAVDLLLYPERTNGRMKPVYFLPTARQYLEELQEIAKTQDNQALARWSEEKKRLQSMRLAVRVERVL